MIMRKSIFILFIGLAACSTVLLTGCKKATINVNASSGDGDITGKGGSKTEVFDWENNQSKAEYNMDITAANGGTFQLIVEDAAGTVVIDEMLTAGTAPDSKDGCSGTGVSGTWKVTLKIVDFDGDGSYSLSKGC